MGLDTFASRSPLDIELNDEDLQAFQEANIELCGGIFSGNGNDGSFRGEVYVIMIADITGQNLFKGWIPPETVREMYTSLMACNPEEVFKENDWYGCIQEDLIELRKFFRVCCEYNLGLLNSG
jgi:hypothetical protein